MLYVAYYFSFVRKTELLVLFFSIDEWKAADLFVNSIVGFNMKVEA
jgi:hypothetical protein